MGVADARRRRSAEAVIDAMEAVPEPERRAMRAFYLDGMSIAEIAARHRCPPGTVKRRLSHGRDRVRRELGITKTRRGTTMRVESKESGKPFPEHRPDITVSRSAGQPFSVDLRELAWWFIVPEVGERVRSAEYEQTRDGSAPKLTEVNAMVARRPAVVHGRECVEIEVDEQAFPDRSGLVPRGHSLDEEYRRTRVWGRLDDAEVQWVAYESTRRGDGMGGLQTFLDERRYNGNRWGKLDRPPHRTGGTEMTWEEELPHAHRLVIDGMTYVHQWDYLTEEPCGL